VPTSVLLGRKRMWMAHTLSPVLLYASQSLRKLIPLADRVLIKRILPKTQVSPLAREIRFSSIMSRRQPRQPRTARDL
jgi:hypothetical protein